MDALRVGDKILTDDGTFSEIFGFLDHDTSTSSPPSHDTVTPISTPTPTPTHTSRPTHTPALENGSF